MYKNTFILLFRLKKLTNWYRVHKVWENKMWMWRVEGKSIHLYIQKCMRISKPAGIVYNVNFGLSAGNMNSRIWIFSFQNLLSKMAVNLANCVQHLFFLSEAKIPSFNSYFLRNLTSNFSFIIKKNYMYIYMYNYVLKWLNIGKN